MDAIGELSINEGRVFIHIKTWRSCYPIDYHRFCLEIWCEKKPRILKRALRKLGLINYFNVIEDGAKSFYAYTSGRMESILNLLHKLEREGKWIKRPPFENMMVREAFLENLRRGVDEI